MHTGWIIVLTLVLIAAIQAVFWGVVFLQWRRRAASAVARLQAAGESVVLTPVGAYYLGWTKNHGLAKTMGALLLTDRRLYFVRPFGAPIDVPLDAIVKVADTVHTLKIAHTTDAYLAVTLQDDVEVVFVVREQARWLEAIRQRMPA